jgi:hypothetical protein
MKAPLIFTFCLMSVVNGCDKGKNEIENNCDPETIIGNWFENKDITVSLDALMVSNLYTVTDGENLLFIYNHAGAQCDYIDDDEWGERLAFVVNKDLTEFEYKDSDITLAKCFYQQYGAWVNYYMYDVKNGVISGKKTSSNTWKINVSVLTTPIVEGESPMAIVFTEAFKK